MLKHLPLSIILLVGVIQTGCTSKAVTEQANTLTEEEKAAGWQLLFDGTSTNGWHSYGQRTIGSAWKIKDSAIFLDTTGKAADSNWQMSNGGDILSNEEYENYHLSLEWKISPKGNSGIIFNAAEDTALYDKAWKSGPEMQVLDDAGHKDGEIHKHRTGDLYDLIESSKPASLPIGEWNKAEVVVNNGKLELILNGTTTVSTTMWDDNWKTLIAGSKFKDTQGFGTIKKGRIALQDHGDNVWFRNIKIKQL